VLGHGLAVQAIRANGPGGTEVGLAENVRNAVPVIETPENVKAAETATLGRNDAFMTVMLEGRHLDSYLEEAGADAPRFTGDDMRAIGSPLDFVGINVYRPGWYVTASEEAPAYRDIPINASHPTMQSDWIVFGPETMYRAAHHMQSIWGARSIYITENGCAASDVVSPDGQVFDSDRVMFMRAYLTQLQRATADGGPVHGYFHWSAEDNFEWIAGY
jgi:beta-glucosidase